MKMILFLMSFLSVTVSQAAAQNFYCSGGSFSSFTASLLTDSAGPGYSDLKNAQISVGGFKQAQLICAGNAKLEKVKCTGFWNNIGSELVEVSFQAVGSQIYLTYQPLSGNTEMTEAPWACEVEVK
jgi:hypothetical protein